MNEAQQSFIRQYFRNSLAGFTNPIWQSQAERLANESDDTIYLAVKLTRWYDEAKKPKKEYALIRVPVEKFGRFLELPVEDDTHYIMYIDDVIRYCLPMIFVSVDYDISKLILSSSRRMRRWNWIMSRMPGHCSGCSVR